jgi:hypothetical protein
VFSNRLHLLPVLALLAVRAPLGGQQGRRTLPGTRTDSSATPGTASVLRPSGTGARAAYGVIDGLVTDTSLVPPRGARVSILRTSLQVGTGPRGRFRIVDVPSGQYIVIVRRSGYFPSSQVLQVNPSDTRLISYTLAAVPAQLAQVTITE